MKDSYCWECARRFSGRNSRRRNSKPTSSRVDVILARVESPRISPDRSSLLRRALGRRENPAFRRFDDPVDTIQSSNVDVGSRRVRFVTSCEKTPPRWATRDAAESAPRAEETESRPVPRRNDACRECRECRDRDAEPRRRDETRMSPRDARAVPTLRERLAVTYTRASPCYRCTGNINPRTARFGIHV